MEALHHELSENHFRVAIFGSARIKRKGSDYRQIHALAKKIAEQGIDIVTGGGPGIMEAANKGHNDGKRKNGNHSHSIGLTIRLPSGQKANAHLDIKKDFDRFSNRLDYFMSLAHVVVVAPGGIGTLLELMYTWQLIQVREICHIPIILMGKMWEGLIGWIEAWPLKKRYLNPEDLHPIFFAETPKEAMKIIAKTHETFKKGGRNSCLNLKRYKIKSNA